tara:strand:- start:462 stop:725 length:264 start_codon:yes stop_codon:yes gene_type:complete
MQSWIIVLVIYFSGNSDRVDIHTTDLIFKDPLKCNEFKLSKEFQNELKRKYKDMGIDYVHPYCRPMKEGEDKIIVQENEETQREQRI